MLCISDDPITPFLYAAQSIGAIIIAVLLGVLFARYKTKFTPVVRAICLFAMLAVIVLAVVLAIVYAGDPCPQPDLNL